MRRMLLLTATAALAAVAVALTGGARPAQADTSTLFGPITRAFEVLAGGGQPQQVVPQVVAIFEDVRGDVLSELDKLTVADARACARRHVLEFASIPQLSPAAAQTWATDATACTTLIGNHLATTTDKATVDKLGLAANVAGAIATTARLHAGLTNDALRLTLVRANKTVLTKIPPTCTEFPVYLDEDDVYELWYQCLAYHHVWGDLTGKAESFQLFWLSNNLPAGPPVDKERIRREATKHTSWPLAATVLPLL